MRYGISEEELAYFRAQGGSVLVAEIDRMRSLRELDLITIARYRERLDELRAAAADYLDVWSCTEAPLGRTDELNAKEARLEKAIEGK